MRAFLVFALAASAAAQLKFSSDSTEAPKKDVNTRLGLLGTSLGLSPTAEQTSSGLTQGSGSGSQSSAFTQGKGWPWTEDCEPSQCQHQLSNQHLPPWTEGLLLRPLCRPLCLRTFM